MVLHMKDIGHDPVTGTDYRYNESSQDCGDCALEEKCGPIC